MNNWYFTSDLHLGHINNKGGFGEFRKLFFSSIEEHDTKILQNLLSIPKGSNLAILGDLFNKGYTKDKIDNFFKSFKQAKINVHIIYGNHDRPQQFKTNCSQYSAIKSIAFLKNLVIDKQSIMLSHYNMVVWNKSHYNAWLLYGHEHYNDYTYKKANLPENRNFYFGKKLNVNVEFHNFMPWSFTEIQDYMNTRANNWDFIDKKKMEL